MIYYAPLAGKPYGKVTIAKGPIRKVKVKTNGGQIQCRPTRKRRREKRIYEQMDNRELRFRTAADEIIRSNRRIRDRIRAVKPFYLGDRDVPVPPVEDRLETILNPKSNGACPCLEHFCTAAKEYRPGEYPAKELALLNRTTLRLIHDEIEPIQRTQVCNMLVTLVNDIHRYLTSPSADFTIERHIQQLDKFRNQWSQCCCKNSDAFYEATTALINARKKSTKKAPPKGKGKGNGKGPQTDFKRKQREIFVKFLERKPITPSVSIITRAHQCWLEHKAEWDAAAKDGTGYYDHKKLARAI